jgi:hypothetical protein
VIELPRRHGFAVAWYTLRATVYAYLIGLPTVRWAGFPNDAEPSGELLVGHSVADTTRPQESGSIPAPEGSDDEVQDATDGEGQR